jgi:hypothetical protein
MAKRADRQARRRYRTVAVIAAGAVIAILASACAGGTAGHSGATSRPADTAGKAAGGVRCRVTPSDLLTSAQLPGFTQFVTGSKALLPVHYLASNEPQFVREYVCGEFYGYIINRALTGIYRQQNTSYFEHYGYRPGKWPYVPLRGQIVTDLSHQVLEIYESFYQFTSAAAVKAYLPVTENSPYTIRRLTLALAPGAVVISHLLGSDPATNEHAIYIAIPHGDYAVELEFQGGRSLTWADVEGYWKKLAPQVSALGG